MTQNALPDNSNLKPPYVLALDVGTSSTRTLLFDATGATIETKRERATVRYRIEAPSATNAPDFIRGHRDVVVAMSNDRPEDLEGYRVEQLAEDEQESRPGD